MTSDKPRDSAYHCAQSNRFQNGACERDGNNPITRRGTGQLYHCDILPQMHSVDGTITVKSTTKMHSTDGMIDSWCLLPITTQPQILTLKIKINKTLTQKLSQRFAR